MYWLKYLSEYIISQGYNYGNFNWFIVRIHTSAWDNDSEAAELLPTK